MSFMGNNKQDNQEKPQKIFHLNLSEETAGRTILNVSFNRTRGLVTVAVIFIFLSSCLVSLIVFTPVREAIPGYPSAEFRKQALQNTAKLDSLEEVTALYDIQLLNIQRIVSGRKPYDIDSLYITSGQTYVELSASLKAMAARDDSLLRAEVVSEEMFSVSSKGSRVTQIEGMLFFPPVKGVITESFNPSIRHPFVDIAVPENTTVNSALDGTVISSWWSDETGYTILIQHENDIVTVYKHNARLLKKMGDRVKAGTAIAVAGSSGSLSAGVHLHFELWYKGQPIDPCLHIKF